MSLLISISVPGKPRSRGSKRPVTAGNGKTVLIDQDLHSKAWMDMIRCTAAEAWAGRDLIRGPVEVQVEFHHSRPQSHYGTGRNAGQVKESSPLHHTGTPDVDKSLRGVLDGLTGVLFADDRQVSRAWAVKLWSSQGCKTVIHCLDLADSECR